MARARPKSAGSPGGRKTICCGGPAGARGGRDRCRLLSTCPHAAASVSNKCHTRKKPADKAYSDVGRLRREDGSKPLIALAGCVAQAEGAEAQRRSKLIDMGVGPQACRRL